MTSSAPPPTKRASWPLRVLRNGVLLLVVILALTIFNGIACDQLPGLLGAAAPSSAPHLAARLIEGELCRGQGCTSAVLVQGVLSEQTVQAVVERASRTTENLWVCLDSPGGTRAVSMTSPLPANVNTCVADIVTGDEAARTRAVCASACAWLWMAGRERALFGESTAGFHRSYIYDHAMCAPGNVLKSAESNLMQWFLDQQEPLYSPELKQARGDLRYASLSKGATETHDVDAAAAVAAGLQAEGMGRAFFRATKGGEVQASSSR